jgi:hypothetical protein
MPFNKGQSGNALGNTRRRWIQEKQRIAEARATWAKLLKIRDGLIIERRTVQTADGAQELEVCASIKDLLKCCEIILNRAVGLPKQAIELEGNVNHSLIDRRQIQELMKNPEARAAAELLTKAMLAKQQPGEAILVPPSNGNGNGKR